MEIRGTCLAGVVRPCTSFILSFLSFLLAELAQFYLRAQYVSDDDGVSSLCGTWVTLYQAEADSYARATSAFSSPSPPLILSSFSRFQLTLITSLLPVHAPTVENYTTAISGYNLDASGAVFNTLTSVRFPSFFIFPPLNRSLTHTSHTGHGPRRNADTLVAHKRGQRARPVAFERCCSAPDGDGDDRSSNGAGNDDGGNDGIDGGGR